MTGRISLLVLTTFVLAAQALLRAQEIIVPAGTILQCTLTEPNISSKTVEAGDPILCDAGTLREFGVSVFPRGAYFGGCLAESRDPGHFWGKGWMQLSFDRILLPGAELPISTKVISVPRLKVDAQGRIRGHGNAGRDAVEWAVPILWPEKILTLPMRGPRPALKGENRITLKLMQDVSIPEGAAGLTASRPQLRPGLFRPKPEGGDPILRRDTATLAERANEQSIPAGITLSTTTISSIPEAGPQSVTYLVLKDGRGQVVSDYWFESGQRVRFVSVDGSSGVLPIAVLDLGSTVKLNQERGVNFVVRSPAAGSSSGIANDLPSAREADMAVKVTAAREQ